MLLKKILQTGFFIITLSPAFAQHRNTPKLDSLFHILGESNRFMGSIAMSENGELVYQNNVGYADIESGKKITPQTKFRIGSISKMFTAVLVFKAIEEKRVSLNQKIESFFPGLPKAREISVRQLLSHRSGIHNFTNDAAYQTYYTTPLTEEALLAIIQKGGSDFAPGTKTEYSNANYVLLTFILEKIYKDDYAGILDKKINTPLGLSNTYAGGKTDIKKNECHSYTFKQGWEKSPETDMSIPQGAGNIVSNTTDLIKFIESLFGGNLISAKSLDSMQSIQNNIGMGLIAIPFGDKTGYGHNGGIDGFQSMLYYFPREKVSLCLLSNASSYSLNDIAIAGLSWYFDISFSLPTFKTIDLTSADLDRYLGTYSSADVPLKITITKDKNTLIGQATGQSSFALEATAENIFEFRPAGIVLEFYPKERKMTLKQAGATIVFTRDE